MKDRSSHESPICDADGDATGAPAPDARGPGPGRPLRWLSQLYAAHKNALESHLRRKYGPGPPEPEDVVQQTFTRLATLSEASVAKVDFPKSFLFRAAENVLISEKRRARTRDAHAANTRASGDAGFDFDPERVFVSRAELALIGETIQNMPERRRACFVMHRMEELSFAEIGRRLGISAPAVAAHVERGLADIESALAAAEVQGPRE